jgi:signal transduction histidine kinase
MGNALVSQLDSPHPMSHARLAITIVVCHISFFIIQTQHAEPGEPSDRLRTHSAMVFSTMFASCVLFVLFGATIRGAARFLLLACGWMFFSSAAFAVCDGFALFGPVASMSTSVACTSVQHAYCTFLIGAMCRRRRSRAFAILWIQVLCPAVFLLSCLVSGRTTPDSPVMAMYLVIDAAAHLMTLLPSHGSRVRPDAPPPERAPGPVHIVSMPTDAPARPSTHPALLDLDHCLDVFRALDIGGKMEKAKYARNAYLGVMIPIRLLFFAHAFRRYTTLDALDLILFGVETFQCMVAPLALTFLFIGHMERTRARIIAEAAMEEQRRLVHESKQIVRFVCHEMRSPLAVVSNGISEARAAEGRTESLLVAEMAANQMRYVLDDIVTLSSTKDGKIRVSLQEMSWERLMEETRVASVSTAATMGRHDIRIVARTCVHAENDRVMADRFRLQQALSHLVHNAISVSPHGSSIEMTCDAVAISAAAQAPALARSGSFASLRECVGEDYMTHMNRDVMDICRSERQVGSPPLLLASDARGCAPHVGWFRLCVRDRGPGIHADRAEQLFTPFSAHASGGIGLSVVRHIVAAHGGILGADSKGGVGEAAGSTFWFCVPAQLLRADIKRSASTVASAIASVAALSSSATLPSPSSASLSGMRILVVDDVQSIRDFMCKALARLGASCTQAENGMQCLQMLRAGEAFDVVIMDGNMPVMDGYDATAAIAAEMPHTPVIAVTGNALQEDVDRFLDAGAKRVFIKPVKTDTLVSAISQVVL